MDNGKRAESQRHYCEACADECSKTDAEFNPKLLVGPYARTEKLRVVSVSPERLIARLIRTESLSTPEDWIFPAARLPEEWLKWEAGKEVELTINERELEWLLGKRDSDV